MELILLILSIVAVIVAFFWCIIKMYSTERELRDVENLLQNEKQLAAEQVATLTAKVEETDEARSLRSQLDTYKAKLAEAESRILQGDIAKRFLEDKPTLEAERKALEEAIATKSREMTDMLEKQSLADRLAREIANMESELSLLTKENKRLTDANEKLKEVDEKLQTASEKLKQVEETVASSGKRLATLEDAIKGLEQKKTELQKQYDELLPRVKEAEAISKSLESMKKLQEEIAKTNELMMKDLATIAETRKKGNVVLRQVAFSGLQTHPVFTKPVAQKQFASETQALDSLKKDVRQSGFDLSDRLLFAFHTSLKTSDISSLTVMAGVSGTGKSALPSLYAKSMGIHIATLAVEPRWDSPKDLLGFFNYVTNRYESTGLARALFQFQGHHANTFKPLVDLNDYVLMAMLDEMNLARIEYYFSEFLSKLELRRSGRMEDAHHRNNIGLEIFSGAKGEKHGDEPAFDETPISLFANYNTLFVGTMNEDETTQSLSDKVIDRANVLYFGRPTNLVPRTTKPEETAKEMLRKETWNGWLRALTEKDTQPAGRFNSPAQILKELNNNLADLGRPFAHRTYQAMLAYLSNYPYASANIDEQNHTEFFKRPLADQIGMRIMPKLRGLDLTLHAQTLENIRSVLNKAGDVTLIDAFNTAIDRQKNRSGFFQWQGMDWAHKQ
jgi:hypothetical protein